MRTTIDISDELLRRAKATAALRGQKLKDLVAAGIRRELESAPAEPVVYGHKTPLPEFFPRTGIPVPSLTNAEIEDILLKEDLERLGLDGSA